MHAEPVDLDLSLAQRFIEIDPTRAAMHAEGLPAAAVAELAAALPPPVAATLWRALLPGTAASVLAELPPGAFGAVARLLEPERLAAALARLAPETRTGLLREADAQLVVDLEVLMGYAPDSVGGIMDPNVASFREQALVRNAFEGVRALRDRRVSDVFVVDGEGVLLGSVPLQNLLGADPGERLGDLLAAPVSVPATASHAQLFELIQQTRVASVPVVDFQGRLIGVVRQGSLLAAARTEASVDVQTMMGASRDERALSPARFAVRRRLPWLHVNLATAFLAAAVVGLFEGTIAQFTALAVLLPVVAGQSGNTGSQALAVTMRALALREIRPRHWPMVAVKEFTAGAVNGFAVATVTGFAVLWWSGSTGLAGVIGVAMVASMAIAGLAGASVPIVLQRLGQDPAQASSIILTTVTDVVGFLSFLGLATLASGVL
jgi:magnesium transporter